MLKFVLADLTSESAILASGPRFHLNQELKAMANEDPDPNGQISPQNTVTPALKDRVLNAWKTIPLPLKALTGLAVVVFVMASLCGLAATYNSGSAVIQRWWLAAGWLMALAIVLFSVITAIQAYSSDDDSVVPAALIMNIVIFITSGFVVISFWTSESPRQWASGIIWSAACLLLGGFSGFLFGIPRFRSEGKTRLGSTTSSGGGGAAGAAAPKAQPGQTNAQVTVAEAPRASTATNDQSPIEQIADWLTKTIVGVALVNLEKLPGLLTRWASYVAGGIADPAVAAAVCADKSGCGTTPSFALGIIIYFTIVGFLSGYLLTQVFLQKYVNTH
jgi:hypothetical protein